MTWRLSKVLRGWQPVHCLPGGDLMLWRRGMLYRSDATLARIAPVCALPSRWPVLTRSAPQLLARILRHGVRSSAMLDDDTLLLAQRGTIFRIDLTRGSCVVDFEIPEGRRLLALSVVETDGTRTVCFGEYFHNVAGAPVAIWRRDRTGGWSRGAIFPAGAIDHVHNIVQTADGAIRVLTGDHGEGAAIWRTDAKLGAVERVAGGDQRHRACWLWRSPAGTHYYATDSHLEPNRLLSFDTDAAELSERAPLPGSSIYAGTAERYVAFSTSVEPGEPSGHRLRDFTERAPGPGIVGDAATIQLLDDDGLTLLLSARADGWPLRLAQFATFSFPGGTMPPDRFYAFGRAVRGNDGACLMFERA